MCYILIAIVKNNSSKTKTLPLNANETTDNVGPKILPCFAPLQNTTVMKRLHSIKDNK